MMAAKPVADRQAERLRMVRRQVAARGVSDPAVLSAMETVPRELFVARDVAPSAYADTSLPIEHHQTISQPYIVGLMTEALELTPADRVLEIGTGSGYGAAVIGRIAREVYTVERHAGLAELAARRLTNLNYTNVTVLHADGSQGLPERAPFDAIAVTAAPTQLPRPLCEQLVMGGRLVVPVGNRFDVQTLLRVRRLNEDEYAEDDLGAVAFVPLLDDIDE